MGIFGKSTVEKGLELADKFFHTSEEKANVKKEIMLKNPIQIMRNRGLIAKALVLPYVTIWAIAKIVSFFNYELGHKISEDIVNSDIGNYVGYVAMFYFLVEGGGEKIFTRFLRKKIKKNNSEIKSHKYLMAWGNTQRTTINAIYL